MGCCCSNLPPQVGPAPKGFPKDILCYEQFYINWCKDPAFRCPAIPVAYPKTEADILKICQWAHKNGYRVRPTGRRHNWSPLTIGPNTVTTPKIIIIDNLTYYNQKISHDKEKNQLTAQPGMMLGKFLGELEKVDMGIPHTPAPYDITMGGVLSINGHGTKIASAEEIKAGKPTDNFGTLSNRIVALRLVVFNKEKDDYYELRDFTDKDEEFPALQCAIGRIMMVSFTIQAVPNYYARCRTTFEITAKDLFPEPPKDDQGNYTFPDDSNIGGRFPRKSYAHYVDKFGASEIIWFPFTDAPWLKVWNVVDKKGPELDYCKKMTKTCPFTISDNVPKAATMMMQSALGIDVDPANFTIFQNHAVDFQDTVRKSCCGCCIGFCKDCCANCCPPEPPKFDSQDDEDLYGDDTKTLRPMIAATLGNLWGFAWEGWGSAKLAENFGPTLKAVSEFAVQSEDVWDIWGPSRNTLLYVRSSTMRVTANGYAVWLPRRKLQLGIWLFIDLFTRMQDEYKKDDKYPANMPLEIRVTGPDYGKPVGNKRGPYLSACTTDGVPEDILNDQPVILWLDNLTFPGTPSAPEFYAALEKDLVDMYAKHDMFVRPEWSKGWAYSADGGAYTAKWFNDHTRKSFPQWNTAIDVFDKLDPSRMFSNSHWDTFMSHITDSGALSSPGVNDKEIKQLEEVTKIAVKENHALVADVHPDGKLVHSKPNKKENKQDNAAAATSAAPESEKKEQEEQPVAAAPATDHAPDAAPSAEPADANNNNAESEAATTAPDAQQE